MKPHSQKFIQKRKFIMVLPVLVIPFLTMIFWALGGGKGTAASTKEAQMAGLNPELPDAQFYNHASEWDKLSLYQKAQRDSIKFNEAKRNDPYFKLPRLTGIQDTTKRPNGTRGNVNPSLGKREPWIDENERRVNKKLEELYQNLNPKTEQEKRPRYETGAGDSRQFNSDVEKLEAMMEMMQSNGSEDEEMKQIQGVLDRILDIQHPERVKARSNADHNIQDQVAFPVSASNDHSIGLIFHNTVIADSVHALAYNINRFYGLDEPGLVTSAPQAIEAEVYDPQTLLSGSLIKLKLMKEVYVNGMLIPKNHFVYGICALNGERLNVTIKSIQHAQQVFPVSLAVFDLDGLEGIYVPGAIARDVAKQSSSQALQDLQISSLNPSLEIQAASAGLETAKNFLGKKARLLKVTVKAGYKVMLVNTNNK